MHVKSGQRGREFVHPQMAMMVPSNGLHERFKKQLAFKVKLAEAEADTHAGRIRLMADVQSDLKAKYGKY